MSLEEVKFTKGEMIFRQGDEGDYCFLIKKGSCSLSRKASSRAKEIKYLELSAGDTFGEHAILADEQRSMTVTADSNIVASRIDAERFIKLIKHPQREKRDITTTVYMTFIVFFSGTHI
jgi:CRP-like cAMP-binding protein